MSDQLSITDSLNPLKNGFKLPDRVIITCDKCGTKYELRKGQSVKCCGVKIGEEEVK